MVTALIALVALAPGSQDQTATGLISKMMSRYHGAQTLTGKLTLTQTAVHPKERGETKGVTDVQFDKPSKLFVSQSINSQATKGQAKIVSDGSRFLYSLPKDDGLGIGDVPSNRVLVEDVFQFNAEKLKNQPLGIGDIYVIGRSGLFLRPEPLDIAIGVRGDLQMFKDQLATVEDQGANKVNGKDVRLIGGGWRQYATAPVSGSYQLAVTRDGELLRYIRKESLEGPTGQPISVTTTWDVDLQIGGQVNPNLFKDGALKPQPQPKPQQPPTGNTKPPSR